MYEQITDEAKCKEAEKKHASDEAKSRCQKKLTDKLSIESALLNFMIKERLPLSKLESVHLKQLIHGNFDCAFKRLNLY